MISIVIGTRPELIKMAPVMRELEARELPFEFIHTNQHYSKELDADIIADLRLSAPAKNLSIFSLPHAAQTGRAMEQLEAYYMEHRPDFVLVHGDTNTTLAGAIAAKKMHIPVGHVEAGLRSFDTSMPEEINRALVDRISDRHFAPTAGAKQNLLHEGHSEASIVVCGNTVVDAMQQHTELAASSPILNELGLEPDRYVLATLHRPETVDSKAHLADAVALLAHAGSQLGQPVVFLAHPRTRKQLDTFAIALPNQVRVIDPVGYIDMIALLSQMTLLLTDSGGLQEEAYVLRRPVMTMRDTTERPETLSANFLIHRSTEAFDEGWQAFEQDCVTWDDELGQGDTSQQIVTAVSEFLS